MASAGIYRLACSGCKKVLKIELSDIPDEDFPIDCPRCKTKVFVRAAAVKAASMRPSPPGAVPTPTTGHWVPVDPPPGEPSRPSDTARSATAPVDDAPLELSRPTRPSSGVVPQRTRDDPPSGFGAKDMTNAILQMSQERSTVAPADDAPIDRPDRGTGPRVVPSNAPRTMPRPGGGPAPGGGVPKPLLAAGAGIAGLMVLVLIGVGIRALIVGSGSTGTTPSTVESDASVMDDLAALKKKYPDPGGTSAELYASGYDLLFSDRDEDHVRAAETLRRAAAAGNAKDARALAAIALDVSLLPRSDRGGLGVTESNQWADYVQRTEPKLAIGALSRAVLLASLDRNDDALATAESARAAHPDDPLAWFVRGWVQRDGAPAKAAEDFRHALSLKAEFPLAQSALADAELAQGHVLAARRALDARAKMGTSSGTAEKLEGDLATRLGDDAAAKKHYEQAVELSPRDVGARIALAWELLRLGDAAGAGGHAKHVIEVDRPAEDASAAQAAEARVILAAALYRIGKFAEAVKAAGEAENEPSTKVMAEYVTGLAQIAAGRPELAADPLKDAQQRAPKNAIIPLALGVAHARASRLEDSIAAYQAAIAIDPDLPAAHLGLAMDFADADLPTRALDELTRMVETTHPVAFWLTRPDPRFPPPPVDVAGAKSRLAKLQADDPNRDSRYRVWEGAIDAIGGSVPAGYARMNVPGLAPASAAFVAGWAMAAGRTADAVRLTARASTARELATHAWAMRASKMRGDERFFARALDQDPHDPFAALGEAADLARRGRKSDARSLLDGAAGRLSPLPLWARTSMSAE